MKHRHASHHRSHNWQVEPLGDRCLLTNSPLTAIPVLDSLPGAAAKLYLDFNGAQTSHWGGYSPFTTPAYDQDGDPTTFSSGELASIHKIWEYVAEDYAPFKIDVTTVAPPSFADRVAQQVVIGGNGSWYDTQTGGISFVDTFTDPVLQNISFVFSKNDANGDPRDTADAASHEAGHGFGLEHQSLYSGGQMVDEYYAGPGDGRAPLMGYAYDATRSVWWKGTSSSPTTIQDDLAVISRSANGFGYRTDDYGNTAATAKSLTPVNGQISLGGVIAQTSDLDDFKFTTTGGNVTFTVAVPTGVNNLDARLELRSRDGATLIAAADPTNSFGATITKTLTAGTYVVVVASHGSYGDVGQYTLSGSYNATIVPPAAPTNLSWSSFAADRVTLIWTDNATNEKSYVVERFINHAWQPIVTLAANTIAYVNTGLASGFSYSYRVRALGFDDAPSAYTPYVTATTRPAAPTGLMATVISSSQIDLTWTDVRGETSYRIERSPDSVNFTSIGTTGAGVTGFSSTGLQAATIYFYRVIAINNAGSSLFSSRVFGKTRSLSTA